LLHHRDALSKLVRERRWIAWLVFIGCTWLLTEVILAQGILYSRIQSLPFISSFHVNYRFTVAFLFPLALAAAVFYSRSAARWPDAKARQVLIIVNVLTLLPLLTYFVPGEDYILRDYNPTDALRIHQDMMAGNTFEVAQVGYTDESNTRALLSHTSNLDPYAPIFGFGLEWYHPQIKPGSVWDISDGRFNMTNPTGYVFPEENGSRPFERIPIEDKKRMADFVAHRQPDWKIPSYQQVSNWISGIATVLALATAALYLAAKLLRPNVALSKEPLAQS
jgi:hypothetical protein